MNLKTAPLTGPDRPLQNHSMVITCKTNNQMKHYSLQLGVLLDEGVRTGKKTKLFSTDVEKDSVWELSLPLHHINM